MAKRTRSELHGVRQQVQWGKKMGGMKRKRGGPGQRVQLKLGLSGSLGGSRSWRGRGDWGVLAVLSTAQVLRQGWAHSFQSNSELACPRSQGQPIQPLPLSHSGSSVGAGADEQRSPVREVLGGVSAPWQGSARPQGLCLSSVEGSQRTFPPLLVCSGVYLCVHLLTPLLAATVQAQVPSLSYAYQG